MLTLVHLICKLTTMTSNEILKADVLDILFENRNKQYGAYALRKYYNNRLGMALGLGLSAILAMGFWLNQSSVHSQYSEPEFKKEVVKLIACPIIPLEEPDKPATPPAARPATPVATIRHTNILIVPDVPPNEAMPEVGDLADPQIGTRTVAGDLPTVNHTIDSPPAPPAAGTGNTDMEETRFAPVERLPEFPGGVSAWSAFLGRHLRVPDELEAGERRTVQVRFWVGEDGSVTRFEVAQTAGAAFDNEVIRVLKKMPKWKPAIQNGHPVAVTFTQPVTFQAVEE